MPKAEDLTGMRFGRLVVERVSENKISGKKAWVCKCDCGGTKEATTQNLKSGVVTSCGCATFERNDLTGKKFGKWVVLKRGDGNKWLCRCECGTEREVVGATLKNGTSTSCGCAERVQKPKNDLTGKHFGKLTVIEYIGKSSWKCRCACGNTVIASSSSLNCGRRTSCGCARKHDIEDLSGKQFHDLTVVKRVENDSNGRSMWKCKCVCGNELVVSGKHLRNGNTKSCGCRRNLPHYIDLTGQTFGYLTVIGLHETRFGKAYWDCVCNKCGKLKVVLGQSLRDGLVYSCGCANVSHNGSKVENDIKDFVLSFGYGVEKANRILDGKEIDIYVPEKNLGIEYNGSKVHASVNNAFLNKEMFYHRDKFLLAKEKGIHLISIFDVDWEKNSDKIKMYLKFLLSSNIIIHGRECDVRRIDDNIACDFAEKYHLQGANIRFMKINYGLFFGGELLGVMAFGKLRLTETKDGEFELHRYCMKDGYTVVGGANKLLKAFEREYNPKFILSYSDNDFFLGGIYEKLGFHYTGQSRPRYYWYLDGQEIKRERCQIKHLKAQYPELVKEAYEKDVANKEDYVMAKLGACKVYRSGNTRWVKTYSDS